MINTTDINALSRRVDSLVRAVATNRAGLEQLAVAATATADAIDLLTVIVDKLTDDV